MPTNHSDSQSPICPRPHPFSQPREKCGNFSASIVSSSIRPEILFGVYLVYVARKGAFLIDLGKTGPHDGVGGGVL